MNCPRCGSKATAREDGGCVKWACVAGCGVGGQQPIGPTPEDTQEALYLDAKHGTGQGDPLVDETKPF